VANARFVGFTLLIFVFLLGAAFLSSGVLFEPLRKLTVELQSMSAQLERKLGQPLTGFVIGPELARLSRGRKAKDEFELLCAEIENFVKKLEGYTRSFHAQTAILTHELKTPLTILKNYLEELRQARDLVRAHELGHGALTEIDRLTQLINDYLQWSVLTSNPGQPNEIYAVKLSEIATKLVSDLNLIHAGRVQLEIKGEALVFAMPDHVRQLLSNLLSNAIHYSPQTEKVQCAISADQLLITDHGPGIPAEVREHLGSPFNRGDLRSHTHKSSGLGLAWVYSLCEKYGWTLHVNSTPAGTQIRVEFT
jgi:signal transduction histidine kinase